MKNYLRAARNKASSLRKKVYRRGKPALKKFLSNTKAIQKLTDELHDQFSQNASAQELYQTAAANPEGQNLIRIISPMTNYAEVKARSLERDTRQRMKTAKDALLPTLSTALNVLNQFAPNAVPAAKQQFAKQLGP